MPETTETFTKQDIYELVKKAAQAAADKKAADIVIMDLTKITSMTDYFLICTGEIDVHVKAIVDEIRRQLRQETRPWHVEGYNNLSWVLLDYFDFVVHVFDKEKREFYNIEKLWGDAEIETFEG